MEHMMDYTGIIIHDQYGRRTFSRIITSDGVPNYFETGEKPKAIQEMNIDEVYLIPAEIKDFEKRKRGYFYGYKYLFTAGRHDVVRVGNEQLNVDMSHVQLCSEVQRFRYIIKGNLEIFVDKVYDSLYPTRIFDIECLTKDVGMFILRQTLQCVNEFNSYYIEKEI